nr:hypothetical protein [Spirochaetales bacterium]
VVILLYMVVVISYAVAATTGTLVLRGYVPERSGIEVVSSVEQEKLDLTADNGMARVGTIKENATAKDKGYKVEISSANAQKTAAVQAYLAGSAEGDYVGYQILYQGEEVILHNGSARIGGWASSTYADHNEGLLSVAYGDAQSETTYSDTLTLSVIAN